MIHGEFSSATASALSESASRFALYDQDKTVITLSSDEQVVITDILLDFPAVDTCSIYDGADTTISAGETIMVFVPGGNGDQHAILSLETPHFCKVGTYPKLKTVGNSQVDAVIHGYIVKAIR